MRWYVPRLLIGLFVQAAALAVVGCSGDRIDGRPPPQPADVDATAPSVPTGLAANATGPTQIVVTWNGSTDAGTGVAGYRVYRNGDTAPLATVVAPTYTDNAVVASTGYTYAVRAFDAATPPNESALSAIISITTPAPPGSDTTPPTVPGNVTAVAQSATQVLVSWAASADASGVGGYRVFRSGVAAPVATVQATNYTDGALAPATTYSYTVVAFDTVNPANVSAPSTAVSVTTGQVGGLDMRPANATCLAGDAPRPPFPLALQRVFPNLTFSVPIAMLQEPTRTDRWYVAQKTGIVRVFDNQPSVATTRQFVDVSSLMSFDPNSANDERGLLGIAFHPDYPTDPRVYLFYTANDPTLGLVDRVAQFRSADGGQTIPNTPELVLFSVDDPAPNHNGGNIAFGPDGFLYIGIGDGGNANDSFGTIGNGQNLRTLLGKMLRIDVSAASMATTYAIPPGNPYAGGARCNVNGMSATANCPEIYAYGFRNPWRWSFDRGSGELWLGDVGQGQYEEVDLVTLGGNYGWRCREGAHSFNNHTAATCGPNIGSSIEPVAEYDHNRGFSITGGVVYRGSAIPALQGRYVFADFGSGSLWHIGRDTSPTMTMAAGLPTGLSISSFGQDSAGEVYVVHYGGTLHRLIAGNPSGREMPAQLSATGCVNPANPAQPAAGLIPYAPNAPFYSDGATKSRWLALPDALPISVTPTNDFEFPNGSVLVKNFSLGTQLVETRLFMRHTDGNWAGYTYEWNAAGTEATRVSGGKTVQVAGQTWQFPSEEQCLQCHTAAAARSLGLEIGQLNGDLTYPATGRTANQLTTLNSLSILSPPLAQPPAQLPVIPDPFGAAALDARARAYLHTNCANCHQPGGTAPTNIDLRYTTALGSTNACDVIPQLGALGIADPRLIAPGSAARSVVVARVNRVGADAMPPLSKHTIDTAGVQLLTTWVNGLANCN
jgi:uncharacterized repeat protein (TIGR03806 family)